MTSWVHLFSKFTAEALLLEAALISLLIGCFFTYTVLRKRRTGTQEEAVPSSVVKVYLNELITDAEHLRSQLFGLLESSGIAPGTITSSDAERAAELAARHGANPLSGSTDSELLHQISALEARMKDQSRAMDLLVQEKSRIEGELTVARSHSSKESTGLMASGSDSEELRKKISQLENKLSEYSVIEDDLVNLKRIQQENYELKNRLAAAATPSLVAAAAPVATPEASQDKATQQEEPKSAESDLLAEFEKMLQG